MEKITIQDVRNAILKIVKNQEMSDFVEKLNDDELFQSNVKQDFHMVSGQIGCIIEQLNKDKHINLPNELYKVLQDNIVKTIVDTVNLYLQEEEKLKITVKECPF